MQLYARLTVVVTTLAVFSGTSLATDADGSVVAKVPGGGAEGNYVLLKLKDRTQDTIYPYIDGGAHCMKLDTNNKYTGDIEMVGSISCKFYYWDDCAKTGIQSAWFSPGSKKKVEFGMKAFACKLPMASYDVAPLP